MTLHVVILAAGHGKRMLSNTPKVLHKLAGKALLAHVLDAVQRLNPSAIHIVIGHEGTLIRDAFMHLNLNWVWQHEPCGTGHAVLQALPEIPEEADVLILCADVPLITETILSSLVHPDNTVQHALRFLVSKVDNPTGLGRVIRDQQHAVTAIVEEKDANEEQRAIHEINSGIYCVQAAQLKRWLPKLSCHNAQKEYYLTEIIHMAVNEQVPIYTVTAEPAWRVHGINNRLQLMQLERALQVHQAHDLLEQGVTIADHQRIDLRGELTCGRDVFIDINVIFNGRNTLGDGCHIGAHCSLTNVTLGKNCIIKDHCVLEDCVVDDFCEVGPFARIRPKTHLHAHVHVGNFVELKHATLGAHSKAGHLSYLGDVTIGSHVNIGAGTITCNYDGVNKHQTIIEDHAFIGSGSQLVAPVTVGPHATIGAGTTLRKSAPAHELTLTVAAQKTIPGWKKKQ